MGFWKTSQFAKSSLFPVPIHKVSRSHYKFSQLPAAIKLGWSKDMALINKFAPAFQKPPVNQFFVSSFLYFICFLLLLLLLVHVSNSYVPILGAAPLSFPSQVWPPTYWSHNITLSNFTCILDLMIQLMAPCEDIKVPGNKTNMGPLKTVWSNEVLDNGCSPEERELYWIWLLLVAWRKPLVYLPVF